MSDCRSAEASEEADQTVANRVVVPKEKPGFQFMLIVSSGNINCFSNKPGVCSLVAAPGASSVAAPARVEHLGGKV